jgi:hypothetical protein
MNFLIFKFVNMYSLKRQLVPHLEVEYNSYDMNITKIQDELFKHIFMCN